MEFKSIRYLGYSTWDLFLDLCDLLCDFFENLIHMQQSQLPVEFIQRIEAEYPKQAKRIVHGFSENPKVSIRLNPKKLSNNNFSHLKSVPWESNGFYLPERPVFTADPLFFAGAYYVQEASSMLLGYIVKQLQQTHSFHTVLDISAAPGGKTTQLCSVLPKTSLIVANEIIKSRAYILKENLQKWGNSNCLVTQNKPEDFTKFSNFFDLIVADAPCSGEGMFRKDPDSISHWNADAIEHCASRQKSILDAIFPSLKPGGFLIYSTCTLNRNENDDILSYLTQHYPCEAISFEDLDSFEILKQADSPVYRCFPGLIEGEGFSFFCIRKMDSLESGNSSTKKQRKSHLNPVNPQHLSILKDFSTEEVDWFEFQKQFLALPRALSATIQHLSSELHIIKVGTELGGFKGNEIRPETEWVLSDLYPPHFFPDIPLSYEQSIQFLKRESIFPEAYPIGFSTVSYQSVILGITKNSINRLNNLYPMDWRIRMNITQEHFFSIGGF